MQGAIKRTTQSKNVQESLNKTSKNKSQQKLKYTFAKNFEILKGV